MAVLPRLDKCECGREALQHCPIVKHPHHTQTREHHVRHVQGHLTLLQLCSRQHPLLAWRSSAVTS
eukprot:1730396-Prorocentrum_lima.AAC.1